MWKKHNLKQIKIEIMKQKSNLIFNFKYLLSLFLCLKKV